MTDHSPAIWKTYISAPRWAGVAVGLRKAALVLNVDLEITAEEKGWLRTTVFFTVKGPMNVLTVFKEHMTKVMREYNED